MASVKETKNPIGFNIYLFKKSEKIKITNAIAKTVLIIKFFLSATAIKISFASLVTTMYPVIVSFNLSSLIVLTKKELLISFSKVIG